MGLSEGVYRITCEDGQLVLFASPSGLVGEPILCVYGEDDQFTPVHVRPHGGDKYILTPVGPHMSGGPVIAIRRDADDQVVTLLSPGPENITEWAIDSSGGDTCTLQPGPETGLGGMHWTAMGHRRPIVLQGLEGRPTQNWKFKKLDE
ncbi:hypothetical protein ACGC1H_005032 [Rhizoctonia solani]